MADEKTFTLGITMAGAISAGAYTAGVLDFLCRALDAHDQRFSDGEVTHRVVLKAMSGASAGGISAALAVAGLVEGPRPGTRVLKVGEVEGDSQGYEIFLRPLHEIWVERVDLSQGGRDALLSTTDLASGKLKSLINSDVIDRQARATLEPVAWDGAKRGWLAKDLEIFITATDLDGTPYIAPFEAEGARGAGHAMAQHSVARHFRVSGLGAAEIPSPWLDMWKADGVPLELPAKNEPVPFHPARDEKIGSMWSELRLTAFASGAFPGGLASRYIHLRADEIIPPEGGRGRGGAMPFDDIDPANRPRPASEFFAAPEPSFFTMQTVDGGVCNNEPFELTRFALRSEENGRLVPNPRTPREADRAVIMIDPFPEGPEYDPQAEKPSADRLLFASIAKLVPTLLNQARFKPLELRDAADIRVRSRFLIAPSRRRRGRGANDELKDAHRDSRRRRRLGRDENGDGRREGAKGAEAIASGLLGGFGGFLNEDFRKHDFILGQRNAQSFLQRVFVLHPENPVVADTVAAASDDQRADWGDKVPILPLPPHLADPIALPPWPLMPAPLFRAVRDASGRRLRKVVDVLLDGSFNGFGKFAVKLALSFGLRGRLETRVNDAIKKGLHDWELF
ncbi:MAG: hypothetical protein AAF763_08135 [Pseudomonadota bacterium]